MSILYDCRRKNRKGQDDMYRVATCLWTRGANYEGIWAHKTTAGANWLRGLQICGSIWHCTICAAHISNERRKDIALAEQLAGEIGYRVLLVTYTARHDATTDLKGQLEAMAAAYAAVWGSSPAARLKASVGYLGCIRSLEVTHCRRNGWHPHIHALVFVRADADVRAFSDKLRARWQAMAAKHGLTMNEHGFDLVDDTQKLADYIAKYGHEPKWQSADELARWHTKTARKRGQWEHWTPWQLLEFADNGDAGAAELWREYAQVFHGRRQIMWSDGLRAALGMSAELTDEEAANKRLDAAELAQIMLTYDQWKIIRGNDLRAEYLDILASTPVEGIAAAVVELIGTSPVVRIEPDDDGAEELPE